MAVFSFGCLEVILGFLFCFGGIFLALLVCFAGIFFVLGFFTLFVFCSLVFLRACCSFLLYTLIYDESYNS